MASDPPHILLTSVTDEQQDTLLESNSAAGDSADMHLGLSLSGIGRSKRIRTQSEMFPFKPTENRQVPFERCAGCDFSICCRPGHHCTASGSRQFSDCVPLGGSSSEAAVLCRVHAVMSAVHGHSTV